MLKMIKECISNIPNESFETYFNNYMMKIQDENLNREFRFLIDKNINMNINDIDRLVSDTYDKMKEMI